VRAVLTGRLLERGEVLDRSGKPSFDALRYKPTRGPIAFYAFDLLYFDGEDLTQYPLVARKAALKRILRKPITGRIRYTEHIEGQGERLFLELQSLQLEGMVAKRKNSVYARSRSKEWLKIKTAAWQGNHA
jgi:bifunctional non-homologous end joining protein LigD